MGALSARRASLFLLAYLALTSGCSSDDTDRLARVGHKVAARAAALAPDSDNKLARGWQAVSKGSAETSLAARVFNRLRWDKNLADTQIQVSAKGAVIELKGTVQDLDQRRRAVEIAESTAGVEKVVDALETPAPGL